MVDFYVCRNQPSYYTAYKHAKNGGHVNLEKELRSFANPVAVLNTECVRFLLECKATPNVQNEYYKTALREGRVQRKPDVIALLDAWERKVKIQLVKHSRF